MPSNIRQQAAWVSTGNPETVDDATLGQPGTLGTKYTVAASVAGTARVGPGKTYQVVRGDPAMAALPTFANSLVYWQDQDKYVVTNVTTNLNRPAGVLHPIPAAKGNYWHIQIGGRSLVRFIDAPTSACDATGKYVVCNAANAGKVDSIVTAPTIAVIGVTAGTQDGTSKEALVDLQLPETA